MKNNSKKKYVFSQIMDKCPKARTFLLKKGYSFDETTKQMFLKADLAGNVATLMYFDVLKQEQLTLHITKGNHKLGKIPSVAVSPWITCQGKLCHDRGTCYGLHGRFLSFIKFYYMVENTVLLQKHPEEFKAQIKAYFGKHPDVSIFRWFENGDFPDVESVALFDEIAKENKKTAFICMTKQYDKVNKYLEVTGGKYSKNLKLRFSKFEIDGLTMCDNPYDLPLTDVINSKEELHEGAFLCPGTSVGCSKCKACAYTNKEINFEKQN